MLGDKRLEMPKTVGEALAIHGEMGIKCSAVGQCGEHLFANANRLVELNNEVYNKIQELNNTIEELGFDIENMNEY